jgi:hypothetical protein
VFSRSSVILSLAVLLTALSAPVIAQTPEPEKKDEKKPAAPAALPKDAKNATAEQIAEASIVVYGGFGGRENLNQIRKTALERGKFTLTGADGVAKQATYQRWTLRGGTLAAEKIRWDQEYSDARYALVYNGDKIVLVFNDQVYPAREDTAKAFENQIHHGIDSLLRYKENESTLTLTGREKIMGVEFHLIEVTDKQNRRTRFYISTKSYRVMMLEYEEEGIKYRRKFYNYNYAQGTLVPFRSVLWAGDKIVEETEVGTVTYGQKIDESLFPSG